MIYSQIPLKCRFIPINIDDEVFQIVFMTNFPAYLHRASLCYMDLVDNNTDFNEGDILHLADWAKRLYNNKENIADNMDEYIEYCLTSQHQRYIMDNVRFTNIGFDFGDVTPENLNDGVDLYNAILKVI